MPRVPRKSTQSRNPAKIKPSPVREKVAEHLATEHVALRVLSRSRRFDHAKISTEPMSFSQRELGWLAQIATSKAGGRAVQSRPVQVEVIHDLAACRRVANPGVPNERFAASVFDIAAMGASRYSITSEAFRKYLSAMEAVYNLSKNSPAFLQQPNNLLAATTTRVDGKYLGELVENAFREMQGVLTVDRIARSFSDGNPRIRSKISYILRLLHAMGKVNEYSDYVDAQPSRKGIAPRRITTAWVTVGQKPPPREFFPVLDLLERIQNVPTPLAELHFPFKSRGQFFGNPLAKLSYKNTRTTLQIMREAGLVRVYPKKVTKTGHRPLYVELTDKGKRYASEYQRTGEYPTGLDRIVNFVIEKRRKPIE